MARASEAAVVSLIVRLLDRLKAGGYCCSYQLVWGELPGGWPGNWMTVQATLEGGAPEQATPAPAGLPFQIKLYLPADIEGSIALRSEEEGFWPQLGACGGGQLRAVSQLKPVCAWPSWCHGCMA